MSRFRLSLESLGNSENCWTTPKKFFDLLKAKGFIEIPDSSFPKVWVNRQTPSNDQQDYLWVRENSKGKPIGLFKYWKGEWVPVQYFPGNAIMAFTGDPANVELPWRVADGTQGTVDLRDEFVPDGTTVEAAPDPVTVALTLGYMQYVGYDD